MGCSIPGIGLPNHRGPLAGRTVGEVGVTCPHPQQRRFSLHQSLITPKRGGRGGVKIGGSRVVHGVAAVAVQGVGAAASLVLWFLSGRASFSVAAVAAVRQRVWPARDEAAI